jgi:putative RNase toxin 44 of polymorphic toxin system
MGAKQRLQGSWVIGLAVVVTAHAQAPRQSVVRITADDGTFIGTLQPSSRGDTLFLVQPDGNRIRVGTCDDSLVQRVASPSGGRQASVTVRHCGATVDFATRVTLRGSEGQIPIVVFAGRPRVRLRWRDDDHLEIHHSTLAADQIYLDRRSASGVTASIHGDLGTTVPTVVLDYSNFNYGAKSRAVGMTKECLLRIAGWSQEASGLHRAEWGTWSGQPPYGDDPRETSTILDGVHYYETRHQRKE